MTEEERKTMNKADRLALEIWEREWMELGVTEEELDETRRMAAETQAAFYAGRKMDDILSEWDKEERKKKKVKAKKVPVHS